MVAIAANGSATVSTTEGRLSIEACLAAIAFLGLALVATFPLLSDSAGERLGRWIADLLIVLNGCLVVVTLLKGKLKLGLYGILLTTATGSTTSSAAHRTWGRSETGRRRQKQR